MNRCIVDKISIYGVTYAVVDLYALVLQLKKSLEITAKKNVRILYGIGFEYWLVPAYIYGDDSLSMDDAIAISEYIIETVFNIEYDLNK